MKNSKNQNNEDLTMMEQILSEKLNRCEELKDSLLKVFGNFDKEIYKTIHTTYGVGGTYVMNRESF
jgi:hypothetical protein